MSDYLWQTLFLVFAIAFLLALFPFKYVMGALSFAAMTLFLNWFLGKNK